MTDNQTATERVDPTRLTVAFTHTHQFLDISDRGVQTWQVNLADQGQPVGALRATRGLYWKSNNLRDRLTDEQEFLALVAEQLLDPDGSFNSEFDEFTEGSGSVLVVELLDLAAPWQDPLILAGVVSCIIDRLTDNFYAVVLPRDPAADGPALERLLAQAAVLLDAEAFSEHLQIIDTSLAAIEKAAHRVGEQLRFRAHAPGAGVWGEDGWQDEDDEDDEEYEVLTARTAAVMRLALEQLSAEAWQEVAALGGERIARGTGGVFGSLPAVTMGQDHQWRRRMARTFDDLAADLALGPAVEPRSTGEEMALHLAIARAQNLTRGRPRLVAEAVTGLLEDPRDYDWEGCSDVLFEDFTDCAVAA
ncbi:hypothetical protein [Streptacidiphilus sp. EB103A]|uniref:hypothetical protein n=1 Tax=Streptacidiphilus sp. EB103A TaxID=3156275 RepID=UPI0035126AEB